MIELSRTQDEEVGDGTTSVIVLGKFLALCFFLAFKKIDVLADVQLLACSSA